MIAFEVLCGIHVMPRSYRIHAFLLSSLLGGSGLAGASSPGDFVLEEIAPGIFLHRGHHADLEDPARGDSANIGFIEGQRCVAVVDSGGSIATGTRLVLAIQKRVQKPVCYVINTHVHFDHVLGNGAFANEELQFIGHRNLAEALPANREFFAEFFSEELGGGDMAEKLTAPQLLVEKVITIIVWAAAFFLGIDLLGIDLTALAVFSGAFGLAIGFGLQKTFGNLIAGIILLMDRSIKPGDVIAVADLAGNESFGQIRKIGIRAVSVTTRDQREYLIPNENLMINQVENWSYSSKNVRMQVPVGVSYEADMKLAEELMLEAAKSCDRVLSAPPPTVWMSEYGDSSVNFVIHCWITDPEDGVGNVRSAVLKKLWWLFKDNGIEIPFPQRDLHIRGSDQLERLAELMVQGRKPAGSAKE